MTVRQHFDPRSADSRILEIGDRIVYRSDDRSTAYPGMMCHEGANIKQ
jgi:hypothetical protein